MIVLTSFLTPSCIESTSNIAHFVYYTFLQSYLINRQKHLNTRHMKGTGSRARDTSDVQIVLSIDQTRLQKGLP